jgi:hypothetical protein
MSSISIRNNFPAIARKLDALPTDIGNKAMVRALNKTVDQGKTEMARKISNEYRISVGEVKSRLSVSRASAKGALRFTAKLEATRRGKGRSMNLIAFVTKAKVSKAGAKRLGKASLAGQLQFQIKRTGGKKVKPGAFIGNNGRTVFIRVPGTTMAKRSKYSGTKHAEQIEAINTIDVPSMFNARRINSVVRQVILDKFKVNFNRELRVVLEGWAR